MFQWLFAFSVLFCSLHCEEAISENNRQLQIDRVCEEYRKQMAKDSFYIVGMGVGGPEKIEHFNFQLELLTQVPIEIDFARKAYLHSIMSLHAILKGNPEIHPFLNKYPLEPDQFKISLKFLSPIRQPFPSPSIFHVSMDKDQNVRYRAYVPQRHKRVLVHKESFKEAFKIFIQLLENQNKAILLNPVSSS